LNINILESKNNPNASIKGNFIADTISKLDNIGLNISNLDWYNKAIAFATKFM